jgi:hypothetical protein
MRKDGEIKISKRDLVRLLSAGLVTSSWMVCVLCRTNVSSQKGPAWVFAGRSVICPPSGEGVQDLHALDNQSWNQMLAGGRPASAFKLGDRQAQGMLGCSYTGSCSNRWKDPQPDVKNVDLKAREFLKTKMRRNLAG